MVHIDRVARNHLEVEGLVVGIASALDHTLGDAHRDGLVTVHIDLTGIHHRSDGIAARHIVVAEDVELGTTVELVGSLLIILR